MKEGYYMSLLAQEAAIGSMTLKNRMIMAPMGPHFQDIDRKAVEYFVARAEGGAAMILINMMVTDYFEDTSASLVLTEENFPLFKEICDRAHAVNCKICVQLMPGCGRMGGPAKMYPVPISASSCGWLYDPQVPCHELTVEEIGKLLDETRRTVELAHKAGVDCYEIHAYGGYLNDQFLTAAWNTRTDEYGGDLKGRARFLLEQVAIAKQYGGNNVPVIVKFCPDHGVPYPGFRQIDEGVELAKYLEEQGIDALHVDAGCYEKWQLAMPPMFYQEAVLQLKSAKAVKKKVSIPVITHGRLSNVEKAEASIKSNICDMVIIGRGLIADPDLPNKVAEGHPEDIRPCISCNEGCIGNVIRGTHVRCALNPFAGMEDERPPLKAAAAKKVLVVGAGPGGCAAAILAKKAGHTVELWEKKSVIGGKTLAASAPYMKTDMLRLSQYYATQLIKNGITVKLLREADESSVKAYAPDVILWAAGGKALRPASIPGINSTNVYSCEDALRNLVPLGDRVSIIGGGQVGVEAAVHFAKMGHSVTVIEMADKLMPDPPFVMNDTMLRDMVVSNGVNTLVNAKVTQITDSSVIAETPDGSTSVACDTVLLAMGWASDADRGKELESICPVIPIGDSNKCRNILAATSEAYDAVKSIC